MKKPPSEQGKAEPHLPFALQAGFAGGRALVDRKQHPSRDDSRLSIARNWPKKSRSASDDFGAMPVACPARTDFRFCLNADIRLLSGVRSELDDDRKAFTQFAMLARAVGLAKQRL